MTFSQEKIQLQKKLQESEQCLHLLEMTDEPDANNAKRYKDSLCQQSTDDILYQLNKQEKCLRVTSDAFIFLHRE